MLISIVLPVYKSKQFLPEIYRRITSLGLNHEIIFVDDGCPIDSWEIIKKFSNDNRVKGIKLSRNFGQHYAISAGLSVAKGDRVIVMDCDLQENPLEIPNLLSSMDENASDIVLTLRNQRSYGIIKNLQASVFYYLMSLLGAKNEYSSQISTFSCLSGRVVQEFLKYKDVHRHYLMIVRVLGFKKSYVKITHSERTEGASSYSFFKLLRHAVDGLVFQSNRILELSIIIGGIFLTIALFMAIKIIWAFMTRDLPPGYASLIFSLFFCSGVILCMLGLHGIYMGKILDQTRERPLFIIQETFNGEIQK